MPDSDDQTLPVLPDGTVHHGGQLLHNLLLFGRVCKVLGMDITPNRMIEVAHALAYVALSNRQDVYHTMRALIVTRRRDLEVFDEAFDLFWRRPTDDWTMLNLPAVGDERRGGMKFLMPAGANPSGDTPNTKPAPELTLTAVVPTYSQHEVLRYKDFADMTDEEMASARQIMDKLPQSLGFRRTRRLKPGKGPNLDLRRTLRENMRYHGEILTLPTNAPRFKPRPVVLICDISGSMERYTRIFLHFMHTFASRMDQVESFVFSVHLTRITHAIRHKSVDHALEEVGTTVKDWGGGTRTGEALRAFNYRWSRRVLGRGAIVLLITDGWDRGDPDLLRHEAARLQRSCYRFIWLNPLLDLPQYEPLTRGAQAILPYTDDFLPLRNLANLEVIVKELQKLNWRQNSRMRNRTVSLNR
ncbi:MAG: VWA domain-containing protein [Anaerolineae bacterium]|nr:VWA domain-containing protein [Anaerolineae bacterium]